MTKNAICVGPLDDLSDAFALMRRKGIRHLPVIDNGKLVGILSDRDIFRRGSLDDGANQVGRQTVGQVMTHALHTSKASDSLAHAAHLMTTHHIDALPILDEKGAVHGIITSTDLLRHLIAAAQQGGGDVAALLEHRLQRYDFGSYCAE